MPIVFYTGQRAWRADLSAAALMDLPPSLRRFTPRFDTLYLPLKQTPAERLTAARHPLGWVLRVMRAEEASPPDMKSALQEAAAELGALSKKERATWEEAIAFLWLLIQHRRPVEEHKVLTRVIEDSIRDRRRKHEVRAMFKTMIDVWREEGEARGEVKGEQNAILQLLQLKFGDLPPVVVKRVRAIHDLERLNALLKDAWEAQSLKDIRWRTPKKR